MKKSSTFSTLRELAEKALEQATTSLGQVQQAHIQAQQQLDMLYNYYTEYQNRLNEGMSSGINCASLHNYQQFISTLELSIEQQRQVLKQWEDKKEKAVKFWQSRKQKLNAFSTLQQRVEDRHMLLESRQEQKNIDEYAQRNALRKHLQ